jgi:toxin FitB
VVKYLLDTSVLSELVKPVPAETVLAFFRHAVAEDVWLSVVTIGEVVSGIESMPHGKRRRQYEAWLHRSEVQYEGRFLPIDLEICRIWGELTGRLRRGGIQLPMADGLIAATALHHGMHVVTRNVKDFEPTGVLLVNPWETE